MIDKAPNLFPLPQKNKKKLHLNNHRISLENIQESIETKLFSGKLFASSSFYSPSLHPTVEDQVAMAQRISHSLSDISNHQSKGQSMYVNRKKRSVKWIHDNGGVEEQQYYEGKGMHSIY